MTRRLFSLLLATLLAIAASGAIAEEEENPFLEVEDFQVLDSFESVEAFEAHIEEYEQKCRDNWITSSLGYKCGVASGLWDRELNIAYKALMGILSPDAKEKLRSSQRSWISFRDETQLFNKVVLDLHYDDGQRMWAPIAGLAHLESLENMTKARTLQLRAWLKDVKSPVSKLLEG